MSLQFGSQLLKHMRHIREVHMVDRGRKLSAKCGAQKPVDLHSLIRAHEPFPSKSADLAPFKPADLAPIF